MVEEELAVPFQLGRVLISIDRSGRVGKVVFDLGGRSRSRAPDSPLAGRVRDYLAGRSRELAAEIAFPACSDFQLDVMKAVRGIPYGATATYGQIAGMVGRRGASRAVGQALGANPVPLFVPCHRVISAQGLGGFSSGLVLKSWLLELEGSFREGAPAAGPVGEG